MNPTSTPRGPSPREQLERLEHYLGEDPSNPWLLEEAFDAALAAGAPERAMRHAQAARAHGADGPAWSWREARLRIATGDLAAAAALLEAVKSQLPAHPAVDHDRAWVHFHAGEYDRCQALLAPWLAAEAGDLGAALEAIQLLWIRAGHQAGRVEATSAWVRGEYAAGRLRPAAAGAASLLLIDDEDFAGARALADPALDQDPAQPEALVARASIALAEQQTARAEQLLEAALALGRDDGRVWSTLGMSSLQAQDLPKAQVRFERALRKMPRHIGTWHALGWTRLLRRDHAGALAAFRAALALDENFAESHGAVGLLLALTGAAEAQHHLKVAERLDPANVTGRYARALLRGEARELAQLQALARRLLDRPGFFGRGLAEEVERAAPAD